MNTRMDSIFLILLAAAQAVVIGNASQGVNVSRNTISGVGQGGVLFYGTAHNTPRGNAVEKNTMRNLGRVLKHVGGVMMKPAWGTYVAHNSISGSPRYGIECKTHAVSACVRV